MSKEIKTHAYNLKAVSRVGGTVSCSDLGGPGEGVLSEGSGRGGVGVVQEPQQLSLNGFTGSHLCPSLSVDGLVGVDIRKSISMFLPLPLPVSSLRHPRIIQSFLIHLIHPPSNPFPPSQYYTQCWPWNGNTKDTGVGHDPC